jgi:hypothetical protein
MRVAGAYRSVSYYVITVICFIVVILFLLSKFERHLTLDEVESRHYSSLKNLLEDVSNLDGQLVICRNNICQDIKTREVVGNGIDGYYIVYPDNTDVTQAIIMHQSVEIKRLIQTGEAL